MLTENSTRITKGHYEIIPSRQRYDVLGLHGREYVDIELDVDEEEEEELATNAPTLIKPDEVMFVCPRCRRPRVVSATLYARLRKPAHCYRCHEFIEKKKRIAKELAS